MPPCDEKTTKLAIVLVCSDWRLHKPIVDLNARIARKLGVDRVDTVALPGPDGLIKPERADEWTVVLAQVKLLIEAHKPVALAVLGHQQCAGHPVPDSQHVTDCAETARRLKTATNFAGPVAAYALVHISDTSWQIERIAEI